MTYNTVKKKKEIKLKEQTSSCLTGKLRAKENWRTRLRGHRSLGLAEVWQIMGTLKDSDVKQPQFHSVDRFRLVVTQACD